MRVEFLVPPGLTGPAAEVAEVLAAEMAWQGAETRVGSAPSGDSGPWTLLVAPPVTGLTVNWSRTVVVNVEPPAGPRFAAMVRAARQARFVYDVDAAALGTWRRAGVSARHLQLGYTPVWDHRLPGLTRDVDLLFMGAASEKRSRAIASGARHLAPYTAKLLFTDVTEPIPSPVTAALHGNEKLDVLARTRVIVDISAGTAPGSDWVRLAQAVACGCAIVGEEGADFGPLRPALDVLAGPADRLGELAASLLGDEARRSKLADSAEGALRGSSMAAAAGQILDELERARPRPATGARSTVAGFRGRLAGDVAAARSLPHRAAGRLIQPMIRGRLDAQEQKMASVLASVKELRLDMIDMRRQLNALSMQGEVEEQRIRTPAYDAARPEVSIVVSLYNYAEHIGPALDSTQLDAGPSRELVVVDDASTDGSAQVAANWFAEHADVPGVLITGRLNRGLPQARNLGVSEARAPLVFILDADNLILPGGLRRLAGALQSDPDAAFAYGILRTFDAEGPLGLTGFYPWDPDLLAYGNYIDAMALIRKQTLERLGGYGTDRRLHGMEDYDLWRRIAASGGHAAFVPEMVGEYRVAATSMLRSTTMISTEVAEALIDERCRAISAATRPC